MRKITTKLLLLPFTTLFSGLLLTINAGCSSNEKEEEKAVIDFEITAITDVTENSALINTDFKSIGKENIIYRGVCIAMQNTPTINDIKYEEQGNTLGQYVVKVENLQYNTKFYARPFITTNSKTIYGNELTFTTKNISVPAVSTLEVSLVTQNSAVFNGKIGNDGSSKILSKGFYFSKTNAKPEYKDQKVESTGDFEFSTSIIDLEQNTTYYVRAFASNIAGSTLGNVISFKTASYILPTLSTAQISTIGETTAIGGGTVVSEGSHSVTERGICWAAYPNPTITNSKTKDGNGIGSFVSNLYSLQPYKLYYVRSYATSEAGTAYGEGVTFYTIGGDKPTVVASARTSNTTLYATVTVKSKGSDNIKSISIGCFDMEGNSVGKVSSSSSWNSQDTSPSVNYEITGLSRNNKYYIIGYATNGVGKGASEKVYFSTL